VRRRRARLFGDCLSLVLPVALALAAGSAVLTSRAEAADPITTYALSGMRQRALPVPYWLDVRFSPPEAAAVRAAFTQWQHDSGSRVTFRYMGAAAVTANSADDGRNVVVRSATPLPRGRGDTIATTIRRPREGSRVVADADILLDFSGRVAWSATGEAHAYDLQSIAAHEVGHLLGLDDVRDPGQLMYWMSAPGELGKHYLRSGDLEGLARAYPRVATARAAR
jgi:hypothetical protein